MGLGVRIKVENITPSNKKPLITLASTESSPMPYDLLTDGPGLSQKGVAEVSVDLGRISKSSGGRKSSLIPLVGMARDSSVRR